MLPNERFAWVWMCALVAVLGTYFVHVAVTDPVALTPLARITRLAIALSALALVFGADRLLARMRRGREHRDERDRAIEQRATSAGYGVLMACMIFTGCVLPFSKAGWGIVDVALLAIMISELTRYAMVVIGYRRS